MEDYNELELGLHIANEETYIYQSRLVFPVLDANDDYLLSCDRWFITQSDSSHLTVSSVGDGSTKLTLNNEIVEKIFDNLNSFIIEGEIVNIVSEIIDYQLSEFLLLNARGSYFFEMGNIIFHFNIDPNEEDSNRVVLKEKLYKN